MLLSCVRMRRGWRALLLGALLGWCSSLAVAQSLADTITNSPPQIDGVPPATATVGQTYSFTPIAYDPNGTPVFFGAIGNPPWMTLDSATGTLAGAPGPGDVGTLNGISLFVSDGYTVTMLDPFSITVVPAEPPVVAVPPVVTPPVTDPPVVTPLPPPTVSSVVLAWQPPTLNEDLSVLTDLAGFRIYYGSTPDLLNNVVDVEAPNAMEYILENLATGDWFFGVTAYNSSGVESGLSSLVEYSIR